MNIEKKILEIYEEINNSKKSLREAALEAPLDNVSVNSPFGSRWGGQHNGVDLAANAAEVKAPADGVVAKVADDEPPCGGTIVIDHADGYRTGFCHMQKINVKSGQEVKQGDVIGISGGGPNDPGKGRSDGRHLHFTLRKDGKLLNPMDYIDKDSVVMSGDSPKSSSDDSVKFFVFLNFLIFFISAFFFCSALNKKNPLSMLCFAMKHKARTYGKVKIYFV